MTQTHQASRFSDLLEVLPDGSPRLLPGIHPIPELLSLDAEQVLARFKQDQVNDFTAVIRQLQEQDNPLYQLMDGLRCVAEKQGDDAFGRTVLFQPGELDRLFHDLHEHVMNHPVWRHPLFLRVFQGDFTSEQLARFATQYFNQVKNTRQCVALALGRFSGLVPMPYGCLNERLSELTQIVLAQLVADEYGVGSHAVDAYPSMADLFDSTTHIVMYRQLFEGLGIPFAEQDQPMLQGVADNVLIQRLVAGHPDFTKLEALASVGLGMEWGVPEFFSLLLGGMIRFAWQSDTPLTSEHLTVFIAHVQYDVLHAIAVMLVTSFYIENERSVSQIKQATNMLMAGRYAMMSDVYQHVFGESCGELGGLELDTRYRIDDRRIERALNEARRNIDAGRVVEGERYQKRTDTPFVFADSM